MIKALSAQNYQLHGIRRVILLMEFHEFIADVNSSLRGKFLKCFKISSRKMAVRVFWV